MKKPVILVDTMGGDHGPSEIIKGCVDTAPSSPLTEFVLLGPEDILTAELNKLGNPGNISIQHASDVITMHDQPTWAVRNKPDSTIVVGSKMVKEGLAQALVTPGNTGAVTAAGLLIIGRIKGISRPGIMIAFPARKHNVYMLDVGANADCKPDNLVDFAIMASTLLKAVNNIENPSVGILSIGEEKGKGNELIKEAYELLEKTNLNFYGNVEGADVPKGTTNIVVCDGFTGNVALKLAESLAKEVFMELKDIANKSLLTRLGGLLLKPELRKLKHKMDAEERGGALLLGVNGICIICHGSSSSKAISSAIKFAVSTVEADVVNKIRDELKGKSFINA
jgi:glycerol-3-phosphate acyltransferase PlsX